MTEGLFILTVIFVAYVVYSTVNDAKEPAKPLAPKMPASPDPNPSTDKPTPPPVVVAAPASPAKPAVAKKTTITKTVVRKGLRDPQSGEVTTAYSNYRFTKRWIKDALVAEGLLDKVYKNNELDAAVEDNIKQALAKLENIDKYRP
ncbi:MAG: hypothetical protein HOP34_16750 [Methylococcaceae bacterium]|nr:hypothetical protein [Methylococcaceae bacterium]